MYEATGIKLQKKVSTNGTVVKTTNYVGGLVYEGTTDKFLHTEEGRVVLKENGQEKEEYQYHLKDHLGNVRVTFTTADREEMTSMYLLTMEPEFAVLEGETFSNLETRQVDVLNNKTEGGKASARLNAFESRVMGPSMSLKVMPGDTIKMNVFAKYDMKAKTKDAVTGMAAIVASSFVTEEMAPEAAIIVRQALQAPLSAAQTTLFAKDHTIPKAYLNYLFFDKNMKYKTGGFKQVSEEALGKFEEMELDFAPQEEGYLMIYVANQTNEPLDVFFDQMAVEHTSGPIIRVDDYYPFGMAFNTGTLTGALTNKYLYNGKELQQELGLDWYDYGARMYDASLGRWFVIDPLSDKYNSFSPYIYTLNNPIIFIDEDGREVVFNYSGCGAKGGGVVSLGMSIQIGTAKDDHGTTFYSAGSYQRFDDFNSSKPGFVVGGDFALANWSRYIDRESKTFKESINREAPLEISVLPFNIIVSDHGFGYGFDLGLGAAFGMINFDEVTSYSFSSEETEAIAAMEDVVLSNLNVENIIDIKDKNGNITGREGYLNIGEKTIKMVSGVNENNSQVYWESEAYKKSVEEKKDYYYGF